VALLIFYLRAQVTILLQILMRDTFLHILIKITVIITTVLKLSLFTPWSRVAKGDAELHSFLTMALHIGAWSISRTGRFVTGARTQVPTAYDLDRPHM